MPQLYSTGPALIYVGINVRWTRVLELIYQFELVQIANQQPQESLLSTNKLVYGLPPEEEPEPPEPPPPVAVIIEQLRTFYVPVFLGTCETPPTIEIVPAWDGVETDAGGTENPSERLSEGEEGILQFDLTRWNEAVYQALAARSPQDGVNNQFPGWGQIGKAMALEGLTYPLWIVFPYSGKPVYGLAGQVPGYRFYRSFLEGPDRLRRLGTTPRLTSLQFRAQRLMQLVEDPTKLLQPLRNYDDIPVTKPVLNLGQVDNFDPDSSIGGLYDYDLSGLPSPS